MAADYSKVIYNSPGQSYTPGTNGDDVIYLLSPSQADGGAGDDRITGSSGNDVITGGAGSDYMYGGGGNDTFLWQTSNIKDPKAVDYVYDFAGAGDNTGDNLVFYGFGKASSFEVTGQQKLSNGAVIYDYLLTNSSNGDSQHIKVTSLNGLKLTADDYHFYASV